ncbi:YHYH domain-containing protein [Ectobacillus sp. sgz5001026]|uniref:YHYH domain-containing protein n=1 Tax=Ectobacillus sp. sgz5001026 TaxID=3242473 RepID=UPI0036D3BDB3
MKQLFLTFVVASLFIFTTNVVEAHPGNTDANGGHYCWTNCAKWGLKYGEYHYPNGEKKSSEGSSTSNDHSSGGNADTSTSKNTSVPSPQEIAQQERQKGDEDGHSTGYAEGYAAAVKNVNPNGSDAYNAGYKNGYEKGYSEGNNKLNGEKDTAQKAGYELGSKQDNLDIPDTYKINNAVQQAFKDGFDQGIKARDEKKKEEFYSLGYKDGKDDSDGNTPKDGKIIYIDAYKDGFKKGQDDLKEQYYKQGYDAAFMILTYEQPKLPKDKYIDWYKEGFESNNEVKKIQNDAYQHGLQGKTLEIPSEYGEAKVIYEHYYNLGKQEYDKKVEQERNTGTSVLGLGLIGWLGRRFYIVRKMIN